MDIKQLIKSLAENDIVDILYELGSDLIDEKGKYLIFTTICHGGDSPKLYYFRESGRFHCFTTCGNIGDIITLIKKIKKCNTSEAVSFIYECVGGNRVIRGFKRNNTYVKVNIQEEVIEQLPIPQKPYIYKLSKQIPIDCWINEGISFEAMKKYSIYYDNYKEQIIIPHFDIDNRVIGIRVRNLNKEDIENYGKYTPYYQYPILYNHPLGKNIYGINITKDAIVKSKKVIIFESEKSVLKMDSIYGKNNCSVAICGSNISNVQYKMLLDLNVEEIIIALDKEENWKSKIVNMTKEIKELVKVSIVYDSDNLLELKDSPIDRGKDIFEQLLKNRINIENFIDNNLMC